MKLSLLLRPQIAQRFQAQRPVFHDGLEPFVTFAPKWSGFGTLALYDDMDEVTICYGEFTHVHVGNSDNGLSEDQRGQLIAADVVQALDDTFADRVEFFANERGGGAGPVGSFRDEPIANRPGTRRGVWSCSIHLPWPSPAPARR